MRCRGQVFTKMKKEMADEQCSPTGATLTETGPDHEHTPLPDMHTVGMDELRDARRDLLQKYVDDESLNTSPSSALTSLSSSSSSRKSVKPVIGGDSVSSGRISYQYLFIFYALCCVLCALCGAMEYYDRYVVPIKVHWLWGMWIVFAPSWPFLIWSGIMSKKSIAKAADVSRKRQDTKIKDD
jgi:hypothetical protein